MNYDKFEDDIHVLVLDLGRAYFEKGAVQNLEKTDAGWRAQVVGQKTYEVVLNGTESVEALICTCPYDHGPVCKHVTATLYAVREYVHSEFGDQIEGLSEEELRKLIKDQVLRSRGFSDHMKKYLDT